MTKGSNLNLYRCQNLYIFNHFFYNDEAKVLVSKFKVEISPITVTHLQNPFWIYFPFPGKGNPSPLLIDMFCLCPMICLGRDAEGVSYSLIRMSLTLTSNRNAGKTLRVKYTRILVLPQVNTTKDLISFFSRKTEFL